MDSIKIRENFNYIYIIPKTMIFFLIKLEKL